MRFNFQFRAIKAYRILYHHKIQMFDSIERERFEKKLNLEENEIIGLTNHKEHYWFHKNKLNIEKIKFKILYIWKCDKNYLYLYSIDDLANFQNFSNFKKIQQ